MKYDECITMETSNRVNDNIIYKTKKKKVSLIDIVIAQTVICVFVSLGVMVYRIVTLFN